jgi:hypothetical protein
VHIPLKLVTEVVKATCHLCEEAAVCIRVNVFGKTGLSETPLTCLECISDGVEHAVELEEPEVEITSKRKGFKENKRLSRKQEIDLADDLGGKVQLNSGATVGSKGDVRVKGEYRVEAKFTAANSYKLDLDELYKIQSECEGLEKPLFIVDFLDKHTKKPKDRFAVLQYDQLKELIDAARKPR